MFRALLAHPQEVPHKRRLVYCVRIMSVGCGTVAVKRLIMHGTNTEPLLLGAGVIHLIERTELVIGETSVTMLQSI
jgi:hypothetical protein